MCAWELVFDILLWPSGSWETKVSNREKRQQKRKEKGAGDSSPSPGGDDSPANPSPAPEAAKPTNQKKSKGTGVPQPTDLLLHVLAIASSLRPLTTGSCHQNDTAVVSFCSTNCGVIWACMCACVLCLTSVCVYRVGFTETPFFIFLVSSHWFSGLLQANRLLICSSCGKCCLALRGLCKWLFL